tara:strand:- start:257 stop:475 length:219 start_codon:yes stop_codon:yes gene_type:complete
MAEGNFLTSPNAKAVFTKNFMEMVETDMVNLDLQMFDVFLIWTLGRNRYIDSQRKTGKQKEEETNDTTDNNG